ncbi:helix-turn-helix domain-containing protein [Mucilaginibacter sp. AW1-3]
MIKRAQKYTFSLLNVDHVELGANWNYKNVISPYYRIYYIEAGMGEISNISGTVQLEAGYLYVIPSFTLCNLKCDNHLDQYFVQFFEESSDGISLFAYNRSVIKIKATENDVSNFRRLLEINPGRGINRSDNPKIYERNIFYKEYQELNNRQHLPAFLETQGIIMQLLARFLASAAVTQKETGIIPVKILDAISYISLHLHQKLSVTHLAERANQNSEYFSRSFQRHTGDRPLNYINEKRIERAQYLIVTSQLTYAQIAAQTGFDNQSHFSRVFKKITGMPPRIYKVRFGDQFFFRSVSG